MNQMLANMFSPGTDLKAVKGFLQAITKSRTGPGFTMPSAKRGFERDEKLSILRLAMTYRYDGVLGGAQATEWFKASA